MTENQSIVEVENLYFSHSGQERPVLRGITLSLQHGEIVLMTGPSGSGKSTLLTIVGGLRHARVGRVRVLGEDLVGSPATTLLKVRRQSGYIFQYHNLLESLTTVQNICLTLELDGSLGEETRQAMARKMLDGVGLSAHYDKYPHQLSGGQRQRVSIARALVGRPRLILADEPTASLDKKSGQECVELLKNLAQEQNTTILLVTHDYRILDMATRVVYMEDGVLQAEKPQ